MNLKEAARQLNITQTATSESLQILFGHIPEDISKEQLDKVIKHLAMLGDASIVLSTYDKVQSEQVTTQKNELEAIKNNKEVLTKLQSIVGGRNYNNNLKIWRAYLTFHLNKAVQDHQFELLKMEQAIENSTANTFDRMTEKVKRNIRDSSKQFTWDISQDLEESLKVLREQERNLSVSNITSDQEMIDLVNQLMDLL